MLKRVSDLLHTVDRESRSLDAAEARALRNEIEGHLDAAIMARLELGATPEEAEQEAIAAFGDICGIVRAMRPPDTASWFDRPFFLTVGLAWLALFAAGYLGANFFSIFSGTVNAIVVLLSLCLVGVVVRQSARARRIQLLPVLALFPIFTLIGAIGQAATALPARNYDTAMDRSAALEAIEEFQARGKEFDQALERYDKLRREFDRGSMVAPTLTRTNYSEVVYETAKSRAEGAEAWARTDKNWKSVSLVIPAASRNHIAELTERLEAPFYISVFGWLGLSAGITIVPTILTLLLNLFVAFVAWIYRRFPRRGQTA